MILGGCGKVEENINQPLTEPEANSTAPDVIYTEPPLMELQSVSDEPQSAFLRSGGYNWTYLGSEDVTMEAAYASPKGIHLVFTNHTNEEYMFGDDYELQAWQDGEWRKVDYFIDNAAFNDIGYCLAGNSSVGWGVKWTYFHGILPDGVYRIMKTINRGTGKEMEKYRLAAEFTITNISSRL